ncbi:MAG: hypothetical protein KJ880_00485 [Candidatus Omnitrophica bacterium]|nr:hypothetical protein [Candidatus Omnitrophota bacterium]MBU1869446.1 hypothetical protein [Candidatus Omnitrophota bacterium]
MVYLFLGQDSPAKDIQLKKIRQEFLARGTEQFNTDTLYSKELNLKGLQEKLLCLPANNAKRIVVIKSAENLKEELRQFILGFVKKPYKEIVLVLDIGDYQKRDGFVNQVQRHAKVFRFKEAIRVDAFTLSRWIALKKADYALKVLNQLLKEGERPERILGGLRYAWEKESASPLETKKRLKLLLNCDIEIKTGRLKPAFALEKLVISLCGFTGGKPFG